MAQFADQAFDRLLNGQADDSTVSPCLDPVTLDAVMRVLDHLENVHAVTDTREGAAGAVSVSVQ